MSDTPSPRTAMQAASKAAGVAGAGLGLAALFAAAYYPAQTVALWALCVACAVSLGFFAVAERRLIARASRARGTRHGANALAITLVFLGILVIGNVLAGRHNKKWDLTGDKAFTLSEQTRKLLRGLDGDVTVTAFFPDGADSREPMKRLLETYRDETPHLKVSFVDPDKMPEVARRQAVRDYGTTVFSRGEQTYRITQASEEAITNALVRVTRKGKKTLYFLSGHGEHALDDTQRTGYSAVKKVLDEQGFAPKDLLLLRDAEVPTDCDVLVVAGPTKPLLEQETAALKAYLDHGGKVLLLIDPMTQPGLDSLLTQWGVVLHNDVVVDTMSRLFGGSYTTPIVSEYPPHGITSGFKLATFLPLARSLAAAKTLPKGITFSPIGRTSPQAWGETNLKDDRASFDVASDFKGPLTVAGLFEKKEVFGAAEQKAGAQLLIVGDSDFADNTYFNFSGNGDLFQNMVSYLAKEQDLISVRPKDAKPSPMVLTRAQAATLFYASVVVAPLGLAIVGVAIWWRRKNL